MLILRTSTSTVPDAVPLSLDPKSTAEHQLRREERAKERNSKPSAQGTSLMSDRTFQPAVTRDLYCTVAGSIC